jgi:hypothetical protein
MDYYFFHVLYNIANGMCEKNREREMFFYNPVHLTSTDVTFSSDKEKILLLVIR